MNLSSHSDHLKQALALAKLRRGFCAPNPCVGAVLVKNDALVASGYHWANGHPHAEAEVLSKVDSSVAKGATLYVTLQPCCHTAKKTPPCDQLLIKKGITEVVYGFRDPNPAVSEESDQRLRYAGITCTHHTLPEIDCFYASYQFWWQHKRPFATAKLAISLDGKIAGAQGKRVQITGEIARQFTHRQRQSSDMILTTARTISLDNPALNVRLNGTVIAKPLAILDRTLSLSGTEQVFLHANPIILFHKANLPAELFKKYDLDRVKLIAVREDKEGLNLTEVLQQLGQYGYHDLWIEAGGHCFQSLAKDRLLQRALIYVAPKWLGPQAQTAFDDTALFADTSSPPPRRLGRDVCFEFHWHRK